MIQRREKTWDRQTDREADREADRGSDGTEATRPHTKRGSKKPNDTRREENIVNTYLLNQKITFCLQFSL